MHFLGKNIVTWSLKTQSSMVHQQQIKLVNLMVRILLQCIMVYCGSSRTAVNFQKSFKMNSFLLGVFLLFCFETFL